MTKACAKCSEVKDAAEFYTRKRDGKLSSYCKPCHTGSAAAWNAANKDHRREYNKQWAARNPERRRASKIKSTYGLDKEAHAALRGSQNGCCAACAEPLQGGRREAVDHHHETGVVRGILCCWCNKALGHARESTDRLRALAAYLETNS